MTCGKFSTNAPVDVDSSNRCGVLCGYMGRNLAYVWPRLYSFSDDAEEKALKLHWDNRDEHSSTWASVFNVSYFAGIQRVHKKSIQIAKAHKS